MKCTTIKKPATVIIIANGVTVDRWKTGFVELPRHGEYIRGTHEEHDKIVSDENYYMVCLTVHEAGEAHVICASCLTEAVRWLEETSAH